MIPDARRTFRPSTKLHSSLLKEKHNRNIYSISSVQVASLEELLKAHPLMAGEPLVRGLALARNSLAVKSSETMNL